MTYAEFHFHLLHGLDDGPRTLGESLALARAAVAEGTSVVVATPHVHPAHVTDPAEIRERVQMLAGRLGTEGIGLHVLPGGELEHSMVERLSQRDLQVIAQGPPDRRWLLLEAPFDGLGDDFTEAADELRTRGFGILLAHPERAGRSPQTRAALEHELAHGTALQLTAVSLTGANGERAQDLAFELLSAAPLAVIASDAHGLHRMPALSKAIVSLAAAGVPNPRRLAGEIPRRLLAEGLHAPSAITGHFAHRSIPRALA
jgi:protein-tyrosine phosphatase